MFLLWGILLFELPQKDAPPTASKTRPSHAETNGHLHRPFTPFSLDFPPFSRIFAAKQVQKWEGGVAPPVRLHLMVITMIALPILNVSLTSFSSIMVSFWTCFSYSLLPPTKPQIPTQRPTPQPLTPQNSAPPFTNQKVQKRRFVGIPVGLTPPVMVIRPHRAAPSPPSSVTGTFFLPIREAPSLASATLAEGQKSPTGTSRPQPQKHAHRTPSKPEFLRFFAPFPLDFLPFRCIFSTTTSTRGERLHPLSPWDLTTMVIFLTFITPFSITVSSLISVIIINFEVVFPTLFKVFGCPSVVSL